MNKLGKEILEILTYLDEINDEVRFEDLKTKFNSSTFSESWKILIANNYIEHGPIWWKINLKGKFELIRLQNSKDLNKTIDATKLLSWVTLAVTALGVFYTYNQAEYSKKANEIQLDANKIQNELLNIELQKSKLSNISPKAPLQQNTCKKTAKDSTKKSK